MAEPLLALRDVRAGYGDSVVLEGISLEVPERGSLAVLGRNGDRLVPTGGLERPEPGGAKHFPGELPVLLVVIDDEDDRRIRRPTAVARVWRRSRHPLMLGSW